MSHIRRRPRLSPVAHTADSGPRQSIATRRTRVAQTLRAWWRALVDGAAGKGEWVRILMVTTVVGVVAVAALHLLIDRAVRGAPVTRWMVLAPALAVAAVLISVFLRAYLEVRRHPDTVRPYIVASFVATITVGVALEAFAGLHLLLWRQESVEAPGAKPELWPVEAAYVWQLVNAVPLLSVPNTIGWDQPRIFTDNLSGVLLLAFKLIVLVPFVQLAVSGVRFALSRLGEALETGRVYFGVRFNSVSGNWRRARAVLALLVMAVAGALTLLFLSDSGSSLNQWLAQTVPAETTIAGRDLPTEWLRVCSGAIAVLIAGTLVWAGMGTAVNAWEDEPPWTNRTLARSLAFVAFTGLFLVLIIELIVALGALLLRAGAAHAEPHLQGSEVGAALEFNMWHVLNGVPGLDIPATLNWRLTNSLTDPWSGVLLLGLKGAIVLSLAAVTLLVVRPHLRQRRTAVADDGDVMLAAILAVRLREGIAAVLRVTRADPAAKPALRWEARRLIDQTEACLPAVRRVLGAGPAEKADTAVRLLRKNVEDKPLSPDTDSQRRDELRAQAEAAIVGYTADVRKALSRAMPTVGRAREQAEDP